MVAPSIDCGACHRCLDGKFTEDGWPVTATRMILCPTCGNKRCPKASDHNLACTDSNEVGQKGSIWENVSLDPVGDLIRERDGWT